MLEFTRTSNGIVFRCPQSAGRLRIIDCQGRTILSKNVKKETLLFVNKHTLGKGIFYGVWEDGKGHSDLRQYYNQE